MLLSAQDWLFVENSRRIFLMWAKIKDNLPYFAAALALVCGILAWNEWRFTVLASEEYLPMMQASETWPSVQGRIVEHVVVDKVSGRASHSPVTHYFAEPHYSYVVSGVAYQGWRVCFDFSNCDTGSEREDAQALLAQFPVGAEVPVYYNPEAPEQSALRPGPRRGDYSLEQEIRDRQLLAILGAVGMLLLSVVTFKTAKEFKSEDTP